MILPAGFAPLWAAPPTLPDQQLWFVFHAGKLLLAARENGIGLPTGATPPLGIERSHFIGLLDGAACWAARSTAEEAPSGHVFEGLRNLFNHLPDALLAVAGRAAQVLDFHRAHRYCGVCASPTELHDEGRARHCPACGESVYPRIAPAMMVLIKRDGAAGRELLLAQGARFPTAFYSALAGFVEPSESLEDCVHRETLEEVGVRIRNLRYFGSQSWPFPHSLMVAFVADYESGDIVCQEGEIVDARWFPLDALPPLPHRMSIARKLLNSVIAEIDPAHPALEEEALRTMRGTETSA